MSAGKHTEGPWTVYADTPSVDPNWHIVTTANRLRVIANVHIEPGNATDEANARLIAAAPATAAERDRLKASNAVLLEALRDMVSDHECLSAATLQFARFAIARAEGRADA